jgi:hypothetical protein
LIHVEEILLEPGIGVFPLRSLALRPPSRVAEVHQDALGALFLTIEEEHASDIGPDRLEICSNPGEVPEAVVDRASDEGQALLRQVLAEEELVRPGAVAELGLMRFGLAVEKIGV